LAPVADLLPEDVGVADVLTGRAMLRTDAPVLHCRTPCLVSRSEHRADGTVDDVPVLCGLGGNLTLTGNDVAADEHGLDTLADNAEAFRLCHGAGDGLVEVRIGIEWLPLASRELIADARHLADDLGIGIHIHPNESRSEVDSSIKRVGLRPTEVAFDAGILGPDCVAAHCVWLSDREMALMRETGTHRAEGARRSALSRVGPTDSGVRPRGQAPGPPRT
jgi:hypothetical protein